MSVPASGLSEGSASLLKDFTVAIAIASIGLALARVVGQPPVLGYLLAGLLIGPFTLPTPLISNLDTIGLLAELGLVLLLFGIGLELGWRRIRSIGFQVLVIGVVEISVLTLFGVWIASILPGFDGIHGLYLGGAIAISSSAILLKGLRDGGNLNSGWGRTIVGILLVEDFAAVILLTVLAGLVIGPFTLPTPLISNLDTIGLLAELGLVLLLFGIGLELGWRRIRSIDFQVLVIGVVEISVLTLFGVWIASILPGFDGIHGLYLGGAIAISSSAILLKGLRDGGNLNSGWGRTMVGILLVEDFAAVILLTVLAGLATTGSASLADVGWLVAKLGVFCIAVLVFGTLLGSRLMRMFSRTNADETVLLASLGLCFLLALCATVLGLSAAAGAFLVGVVIGDTEAAGRVTQLVSPVRDMFGALFFLSIGMLIDYRMLVDFIVPALVVVGVFMAGKIAANTIGSILAGRSPGDSLRVGMTMPQMGEFSLAIGRLSPSDVLGVSPLGAILSIATAATSVLAPLTARASLPLSRWIGRRSPAILHRVMLAVRLGVDTFWSAFSLEGEIGIQLRNAGRSILINICIVVVIGAAGTAALFATPALLGDALEVSKSLVGLIMVGIVMGLSTPSVIAIWRSLERLSRLSTIYPDAEEDNGSGLTLRLTLRAMVKNGLAAVFLILLFLLSLPLIIRMLALGSLTTPLSVILLVAPMIAVGIFSFKVHRVLEPAFNETFLEDPDAEARNVEEHYIIAAATDSIQDEGDPLVVNVIDQLNEQGELIQLLEGKVARQQGESVARSEDQPDTAGHAEK